MLVLVVLSLLLRGARAVATPDHEFDFRGCTTNKILCDSYSPNICATPVNGALCESSGGGMTFDGSSSYLSVTPWSFGGALTVETYVMYSAINYYSAIFEFCDNHNSNSVSIRNENSLKGTFRVFNSAVDSMVTSATIDFFELWTWTHVVATVSGTTMKLYKNGVYSASATLAGAEPTTATMRFFHFIGRACDYTPPQRMFEGTIAYLRFWHGTALSDSDILLLYDSRTNPEKTKSQDSSLPVALIITLSIVLPFVLFGGIWGIIFGILKYQQVKKKEAAGVQLQLRTATAAPPKIAPVLHFGGGGSVETVEGPVTVLAPEAPSGSPSQGDMVGRVTTVEGPVTVLALEAPSGSPSQGDIAGQLKQLHDLRVAGVLTDMEFKSAKAKLLNQPQSGGGGEGNGDIFYVSNVQVVSG